MTYDKRYLNYYLINEMGSLIAPDYVTRAFPKLLKMKQIQAWLGHSDVSTAMNIYAHLDTTSRDISGAMSQALRLPEFRSGYGWQRKQKKPQNIAALRLCTIVFRKRCPRWKNGSVNNGL